LWVRESLFFFTPGLGATLRDELIDQTYIARDVCKPPLQAVDDSVAAFQDQPIFFGVSDQLLTWLYAKLLAKLSGDDDAALRANADGNTGTYCHDS